MGNLASQGKRQKADLKLPINCRQLPVFRKKACAIVISLEPTREHPAGSQLEILRPSRIDPDQIQPERILREKHVQFEFGDDLGLFLKDGIITLAEALTLSDSRPGYLAGVFLLLTVIAGTLYLRRTSRQVKAVKELDARVRKHDSIETFAEGYDEFRASLRDNYRTNRDRETVWEAFDEFNETVVPDDIDGPLRLRNSIRPASFLNVEDLEFGPGI